MPILAKGRTERGRVWVYVRDDRPFGGEDPPAALFYASRDRTREHPERHLADWAGLLQADAFDGYNCLCLPDRKPSPIVEALGWSHGRQALGNHPPLLIARPETSPTPDLLVQGSIDQARLHR